MSVFDDETVAEGDDPIASLGDLRLVDDHDVTVGPRA
jgi:hypothetical protein